MSNFRHPLAKALVPQRALLAAERAAQQPLAAITSGRACSCCLRSALRCRRSLTAAGLVDLVAPRRR